MDLLHKNCVPCKGETKGLSEAEIFRYITTLTGWSSNADHNVISKQFKFRNFATALAFVNQVGAIAEQERHHPDIAFGWGYCTIELSTHSIGGLHENDFIVAAKIDALPLPS